MNFSLGFVEVSALGNAIKMLDEMVKAAEVEFVAVERKLGGRLVTIVVRGSVSSVTAAVEAGRSFAKSAGCLKAAEVIARPHPEILKFLHLDEEKTEPEAKALKEPAPAKKTQTKKAAPKAASKTTSKSAKTSDIKKAPAKTGKKTK